MIEAAIAAINDNPNLNCREVQELFTDLFDEQSPEELDYEILKDYLKIQKLDEESRYQDISENILAELESENVEFYKTYLEDLERDGIEFVTFFDGYYPDRLWEVPDAPLGLYVDGELSALSDGVAVAGTREAYDHRLNFVEEVAQKLVEMDKTVVSGLANGVDEAAHKGALEAGGKTVAILPGQVKKIRPASNKELGEEIRNNGALVSEVSKRKSIHRGRFVERNRITSGISSAIIIGASGETGGTIHQANFAQEQGRPRFLYTPSEEDGQSPEKLLKKGFVPFETVDELEDLLNEKFEPTASDSTATLDDFS
jgi:DNA processing protein